MENQDFVFKEQGHFFEGNKGTGTPASTHPPTWEGLSHISFIYNIFFSVNLKLQFFLFFCVCFFFFFFFFFCVCVL